MFNVDVQNLHPTVESSHTFRGRFSQFDVDDHHLVDSTLYKLSPTRNMLMYNPLPRRWTNTEIQDRKHLAEEFLERLVAFHVVFQRRIICILRGVGHGQLSQRLRAANHRGTFELT